MHGTRRHQALLDAGGELVTATPRQARALRIEFGRAAAGRGMRVWPSPRILSYGAWLEREVRAHDDRPQLIGDYAARRLWQRIIEHSPEGVALLSAEATAAEAARAWALAHEWRLPLAALAPVTAEEAAFRRWCESFERATAEQGVLDAARLPAWLAARGLGPGPPLGWHGFTAATPARTALEAALAAGERAVSELALEATPGARAWHEAATPDSEHDAIAGWLAARLGADREARLIVILPDLGSRGAAFARRLDDRLAPELLSPGAPDARPYAFSVAPRLAAHAVADCALGVIGLGAAELDVLALGRLLRSPYLPAPPVVAARRALLDVELRRLGSAALDAEAALAHLRAGRGAEPEFAALVVAARASLARRGRHSAADWAEAMQRALRAAGWPKGRALAPREYQAAHAFNEALATLGSLAAILPALDYAAACAELRALVGATTVAAGVDDAPVLVLERLEDPALPCDGLWVAGLTAERFPATAQPTPFLPLALQRSRGVPGATPALALEAARQALGGWLKAPDLVLSAARLDGDTRRVRSPLVPEAPAFAPAAAPPTRAATLRATRRLESWTDPALPALAPAARVAGGVRVLELMSLCPFRAGAELRLGARALESPRNGLAPQLRGQLAHAALATFWGEIGSHAELRARGPTGRATAIAAAVERAFAELGRRLPRSRLVALERDWLARAIDRLTEIELEREPFTVIERETTHRIAPGGLPLEVRVDRVDRLADGSEVIIDYKSGASTPRRWAGPRPEPVQLPAYTIGRDPAPVAVAIARLAIAKSGFVGLAERDGLLPRVRAVAASNRAELAGVDWPGLLADWERSLGGLAAGYAAGAAPVDPSAGACERCPLATLCRISTPDAEAAEEADDD